MNIKFGKKVGFHLVEMFIVFKSAVAFFFLFFLHGTSIGTRHQGISYNYQIDASPYKIMSTETQIYKRLLKYGFKHHKCEHNKRLGILRTFITEDGSKFVEIIQENDSYYSILFSGVFKQYLPYFVDVMFDEDLDYLDAFLKDLKN